MTNILLYVLWGSVEMNGCCNTNHLVTIGKNDNDVIIVAMNSVDHKFR